MRTLSSLSKMSNIELILIIKQERTRIRELESRMNKLDKIWRDYYRRERGKKNEK